MLQQSSIADLQQCLHWGSFDCLHQYSDCLPLCLFICFLDRWLVDSRVSRRNHLDATV